MRKREKMMKKPFKNRLIEVRELLQADEEQTARHLRLSVRDYRALESGGRVLPLPSQMTLERRLKELLKRCGIE